MLVLAGIVLAPAAALQAQTVFGPEATWAGNQRHDFGEISRGDSISIDFQLVNTGTQPLAIQRAKPPCTCTHAYYPKTEIAPKDTATVTIGFASKDSQGEVRKEVLIFTNEPEKPPHKLILLGTVLPKGNAGAADKAPD